MEILDQLKQLKEDALNGFVEKPSQGICYHLGYDESIDILAQSWEYFSGSVGYPVFDELNDVYKSPSFQFFNIDNLWEGRQLELRLSLINHLIKCYEAESK